MIIKPSILFFAIGLLALGAVIVCTTYYMATHDAPLLKTSDIPSELQNFLKDVSTVNWCLNQSKSEESRHLNLSSMVCVELMVVVSADSYPSIRNHSVLSGLSKHKLIFKQDLEVSNSEENIDIVFYLGHNESTSTRHSTDVLIPSYMALSSRTSSLPLDDSDQCTQSLHEIVKVHKPSSSFSQCQPKPRQPRFHVDPRWRLNIELFLSIDHYSLHLMYTSYFMFLTVLVIILYNLVKSRFKVHKKLPVYKRMET